MFGFVFLDRNILIFRIVWSTKLLKRTLHGRLLIVMVSIKMADTIVAVTRLSNDGVFSEESQAHP